MVSHWDQFPSKDSEEFRALVIEGYQEMAEENLREAEEAFLLISEVVLRDDDPEPSNNESPSG